MLILLATDVYGMQIVLYKHNLQRYQHIATDCVYEYICSEYLKIHICMCKMDRLKLCFYCSVKSNNVVPSNFKF